MSDVQRVIADAMQNETMVFVLAGVGILLLGFYLEWVIRRWSWIPRESARKHYACCQGEEWAAKEPPMTLHCVKDEQGNTIGNLKRGDQVKICGYNWTIM